MLMRNFVDGAMRLVNEYMDVISADFAEQMPKPSFGKIIPIVDFHKDRVARGHKTNTIPKLTDAPADGRQISIGDRLYEELR